MKIPKFEAQTEWVKPTEFPDLRDVDEIAIDLETKDPDLIKKGSGSVIGNGDVIGIAVATSFYKGYFPIAHEGGGNMDRSRVLSWLKNILESTSTKVFHNEEVIPAPPGLQKISITLHGLLHMVLDCLMNIQKDMVKHTHVKNHC